MPRLYLVRHGHAESGFAEARDPALDALGCSQAEAAAERLSPLGPISLMTSPLLRARQTCEPLARRWQRVATVEPAVAEVPSPPGLAKRGEWLRSFMAGSWRDVSRELAQWREEAIAAFTAIHEDTVIFSHFIAINVAVGAAEGDHRIVHFRPDNCSVTIMDVDDGTLRLIEHGSEAKTKVG